MAAAAIGIPAVMSTASDSFNDVPNSHQFHDDISAIAEAGITGGCAGGSNYCPSSNVTRGQMAAFMNRLGALSAGKVPVVNALMVNGWVPLSGPESFELTGGAATECEVTSVFLEGEVLGDYQVVHVLYDAPGSTATSSINIGLQEDAAAPNDEIYQVCFSTVDGSNLPAGIYDTHFIWSTFVGSPGFGPAGMTAQSSSEIGRWQRLK